MTEILDEKSHCSLLRFVAKMQVNNDTPHEWTSTQLIYTQTTVASTKQWNRVHMAHGDGEKT
jgi:hypothetical protein